MKVLSLFEMPYLADSELGYQVLAKISKSALKRSYSLFAKTREVHIFAKHPAGFIAGRLTPEYLSTVVKISCRKEAYPIEPSQLNDYQQVSMVNVSEEFAEEGFTKSVYNQIAKNADLVSDHEQYLGAQGLWKSLARESDINVYVFDGREKKDYIRDENGLIVKYNGKNIDDDIIWGTKESHRALLLVATSKELI